MDVWWVVFVLINSHYHLCNSALPLIQHLFSPPFKSITLGSQFHSQANLRQVPVLTLSQTGGQPRDFAALVLNSFRLPSRLSDFWEGSQPLWPPTALYFAANHPIISPWKAILHNLRWAKGITSILSVTLLLSPSYSVISILTKYLHLPLSTYIYMYIYIYICMCIWTEKTTQ